MRRSCDRHYKNLIGLLGVFSMMLGCVSTPKSHETFMTQGFRIALPKAGTKVIVRGNHSEAVNQAIPWLNDHQLLVVNRWVEKEPTTPGMAIEDKTARQAQVQAVAHKVGATLVVFVHVDETQLNQNPTGPMSDGHHPMKMIGVEIQGINVKTGQAAFGAMAWNSKPVVESEQLVQDLTVLALEKSWQEPEDSRSRHQEVTPAVKTEQKAALMTRAPEELSGTPTVAQSASVPLEPSEAPPVAQPASRDSPVNSRAHVTVFTESAPDEVSAAPVATQPVAAEGSKTSEDPSLGLHIASGALSILYTPFKIVYAGLGGFFGCLAYAVTAGNEQVAQSIWDASLRGTYWLTPEHLQGNEPVRFKGEPAN
jgi:hypothetical protein